MYIYIYTKYFYMYIMFHKGNVNSYGKKTVDISTTSLGS